MPTATCHIQSYSDQLLLFKCRRMRQGVKPQEEGGVMQDIGNRQQTFEGLVRKVKVALTGRLPAIYLDQVKVIKTGPSMNK